MDRQWVPFDENFDSSSGGPLYVCTVAEGTYQVAGAMWLDGGQDEAHYFAFVAEFDDGFERDDVVVSDMWTAADAFCMSYDEDVVDKIGDDGWFFELEEAVEAVNRYCGC